MADAESRRGSLENSRHSDCETRDVRHNFNSYRVERIVDESFEVKSFYLKRADGRLVENYLPGQHLMFKIPTGADGMTLRVYTLSDIYNSETYRTSVKKEGPPIENPTLPAGEASNYLHNTLAVGDIIEARGPLGDFTFDWASKRPTTLIAGGIGITPILAILKGILRDRPNQHIHLFLAFKTTRHQIFKNEIDHILKQHPQIICHLFFDEMSESELSHSPNSHARRIDLDVIARILPDLQQSFYICGALPMMTSLVDRLKDAGISDQDIHTEVFRHSHEVETQPIDTRHYEIHFTHTGKTILWTGEHKNLLEFAKSHGIPLTAGCMTGSCGACSIEVEDGEVEYTHTTAHKPKDGHCLACSCKPKSEMRINA
ncbi:hypothetical protein BVX99_03195 [bacterium F16]|nr:hypothetical protein BVX99_03195 [bacterium F16]